MASVSNVNPEQSGSVNSVTNIFQALRVAFGLSAARNSRREHIEFYNAMTDEELAARGIKRDNIVHHVFRDLYYT